MTDSHLLFFGEDWGRHPSTAQFLATELRAAVASDQLYIRVHDGTSQVTRFVARLEDPISVGASLVSSAHWAAPVTLYSEASQPVQVRRSDQSADPLCDRGFRGWSPATSREIGAPSAQAISSSFSTNRSAALADRSILATR